MGDFNVKTCQADDPSNFQLLFSLLEKVDRSFSKDVNLEQEPWNNA